jgi:capsular exopolysaccharide synthesis family protein
MRLWLTSAVSRGQRVQTVMVVSPHRGTGSTTTASLLASTLAEGKKLHVLIADANVRTPALSDVFGVRNGDGLTEVVAGGVPLEAGAQATERQNLAVLSSGRVSMVPADVFEGEAIDRVIEQLKTRFDFIIFDVAPVLEFPDACALAPKVDGVILVVKAGGTSTEQGQRARRTIDAAGGRLLGVVLNREKDYTPRLFKRLAQIGR